MEEIDRKPTVEIKLTKEIADYDETMTTNMLLAETLAQIRSYVVKDPGDPEAGTRPTVSIHMVVIDPENYGDLKEVEWMYKDLTDETEDNAQLDETEE